MSHVLEYSFCSRFSSDLTYSEFRAALTPWWLNSTVHKQAAVDALTRACCCLEDRNAIRQGKNARSEMKCCLPTLFMLEFRKNRRMFSTS